MQHDHRRPLAQNFIGNLSIPTSHTLHARNLNIGKEEHAPETKVTETAQKRLKPGCRDGNFRLPFFDGQLKLNCKLAIGNWKLLEIENRNTKNGLML